MVYPAGNDECEDFDWSVSVPLAPRSPRTSYVIANLVSRVRLIRFEDSLASGTLALQSSRDYYCLHSRQFGKIFGVNGFDAVDISYYFDDVLG